MGRRQKNPRSKSECFYLSDHYDFSKVTDETLKSVSCTRNLQSSTKYSISEAYSHAQPEHASQQEMV